MTVGLVAIGVAWFIIALFAFLEWRNYRRNKR